MRQIQIYCGLIVFPFANEYFLGDIYFLFADSLLNIPWGHVAMPYDSSSSLMKRFHLVHL